MYLLDSGSDGRLNLSAWARKKIEEDEALRKEGEDPLPRKLPHSGITTSNVTYSEVTIRGGVKSYTSPIAPSSAFHIRNRMMSKMGAKVQPNVAMSVAPFFFLAKVPILALFNAERGVAI